MRNMMYLEDINTSRTAFGMRVRAFRKERRLTQEQLAFRVGCDRTLISRIERGRSSVSLDTIVVIASGLDVSPAVLLYGIGKIQARRM